MARSGEKNPGAFMSHPFLLSAASHRCWLDRRERRARSRASNGRRVFLMRRRARLRPHGQGTFSTSISHTSVPSPMKHRLGGVDRQDDPSFRRDERRGHGSRRQSRPPRRAGSVAFATHRSMASTIDLVFGRIRLSNCCDTSVCRHCVISFAHSKVHTGHKSGNS